MDAMFKALADSTRRELLDRLRTHPGQTLSELEAPYQMTRFGIMRHLRVLEEAGLVTTERAGRNKHHFLNPVPLQGLYDRWLDRFTASVSATLLDLKDNLEKPMNAELTHVFEIYIRTTPEQLWQALTDGDRTRHYYYRSVVSSTWEVGAPCDYHIEGALALTGKVLEIEPPRRLVTTFDARWDEEVEKDAPSRIVWEIEPQGDVCRLRVLHDGYEDGTATSASVQGGMSWILSGLKTLLETGEEMAA